MTCIVRGKNDVKINFDDSYKLYVNPIDIL